MREHWQSLRSDAVVRATIGVLLAFALLYLLLHALSEPVALARRALMVMFLALTVVALWRDARSLPYAESRFWRGLGAGFVPWLAVAVLYLAFPDPRKPAAVELTAQVLLVLFYVVIVLAVEAQPHRHEHWQLARLERILMRPGAALFALGLFAYFVLIPLLVRDRAAWAADMFLYVTFDLYLAGRLFLDLALARTPRWRLTFGLLGAGAVLMFANDLLEYLGYAGIFAPRWGTAMDLHLVAPLLCFIVAARLRHAPVEGPAREAVPMSRGFEMPREPSGTSIVWALTFPLAHYTGYALQVLSPASEGPRRWVCFGGAILMGGLALYQHRLFQRRVRSLWVERVELEAALGGGEKDLRLLVERRHAHDSLKAAEDRFEKAFRAVPDAVAVVTRDEGRFVKVNARFAGAVGYRRRDLLGRTVDQLRLWGDREGRVALLRRVRERPSVKEHEVEVRTRAGDVRALRLAVDDVELDDRACFLVVARAVPEGRDG